MTDRAVMAWIGKKIHSSMNDEDGDLSDRRQTLLNYYRGEPYGNERRGYSRVVTREAFETVEWAMPMILQALTGQGDTLSFDPVSEDDIPQAEQETAYVRHMIMKRNNGFLALHHWFKDALMYPNGYIKIIPQERMRRSVETYEGLTEAQAATLAADPSIDVIGQQRYTELVERPVPEGDPGMMPEQGVEAQSVMAPVEETRIDMTLRIRTPDKSITIESVPPEQVLIDDQVRSIDLDKANFISHRVRRTKTELLDMGFDAQKLEQVGSDQDYKWNDETVNRLFHEDENPEDGDEDAGAMQAYWVHESYCWLDYDQDGVAEYRRIVTIGGTVFDNEEVDYQPIIALSSIVMPHQHAGISLIEAVDDLQLVASTLFRSLLNNIYRINQPRTFVANQAMEPDGSTMDALLDAKAEIIPMRGDVHAATKKEEVTSLVAEILPVMQNIDERIATRTGIAPQLSMDPATLQQSTMGAFVGALEKANERLAMIIRLFAETGMRTLMQKVHHCVRKYQDVPGRLRLQGNWVDVDPREWAERDDITVSVGLGFNDRAQLTQLLMGVIEMQKEALPQGLSDPQKLYKTIDKMMGAAGLNAFEYFNDPNSPAFVPPEPPPPDPMVQLAERDLELKGQKQQLEVAQFEAEERRKQEELALKYGSLQGQLDKLMAEVEQLRANAGLAQARTAEAMRP